MKKLWLILIPFALLANYCHRQVDEERFAQSATTRFYLPDPQATRVLSLGMHTMVADLLWVRSMLLFSDFAYDCDKDDAQWLYSMLMTIIELDPTWRTVYLLGGSMMTVCDEYKLSDNIYKLGHEQIPTEPFFPFSLANHAAQEYKDPELALYWMRIAAATPKAPAWYQAAIAGYLDDSGQREASIKYLQDQLETQEEPSIRSFLQERLNMLLHEKYSAALEDTRSKFKAHFGRDIRDVREIGIPFEDPYEQGWILAPDGKIRSQKIEMRTARKMRNAEREWLMLK